MAYELNRTSRYLVMLLMAVCLSLGIIVAGVHVVDAQTGGDDSPTADEVVNTADESLADEVADDATKTPNVQNWQVILGTLQPLVLSLIIQTQMSRQLQSVIAFGFSVVVTTIGMLVAGDTVFSVDWVTGILAVFSASIVTYYGFWKPTGISPGIEAKTSRST